MLSLASEPTQPAVLYVTVNLKVWPAMIAVSRPEVPDTSNAGPLRECHTTLTTDRPVIGGRVQNIYADMSVADRVVLNDAIFTTLDIHRTLQSHSWGPDLQQQSNENF